VCVCVNTMLLLACLTGGWGMLRKKLLQTTSRKAHDFLNNIRHSNFNPSVTLLTWDQTQHFDVWTDDACSVQLVDLGLGASQHRDFQSVMLFRTEIAITYDYIVFRCVQVPINICVFTWSFWIPLLVQFTWNHHMFRLMCLRRPFDLTFALVGLNLLTEASIRLFWYARPFGRVLVGFPRIVFVLPHCLPHSLYVELSRWDGARSFAKRMHQSKGGFGPKFGYVVVLL
jgi:hypothetical protein